MGPHFFKCGKDKSIPGDGVDKRASMGPHFFKCGKVHVRGLAISKDGVASMGPHFFKCGKTH